jgi:Spy/CpxP family protein refolding chaperone
MNKNRLTLAVVVCALMSFSPLIPGARAQIAGDASNPQGRLDFLRARLNLSEEQMERLKPLVEEEAAKVKSLKEDSTLSNAQKKERANELVGAFRAKLSSILTPEQKAKLSEEMQRRAGGGQPQPDVAQRLQALKQKLSLSDDQVEKIKPILEEETPKLKASKDDNSISPEEKRTILKQSWDRISSELTTEQKEKMREQFQKRPN